jgi:hypothetical protein
MSIYNGTPEPEPSISAAEFMRQAKEQKRLRQEQEQEYPIVHGDNWGEYELKQQRRQKRKRLIVVSAVIAGSLALGFVGGSFVKRYQLVPTGKNGSAYLSDRLTGKSWLVHGGAMREVLSGEALEKAEKAKRDERARQDARIEAEYAAERAARQAREDADKVERAREYAANVAREKEQAAKERAQKIAEFNAVVRDPHTAVIDKIYTNPETNESLQRKRDGSGVPARNRNGYLVYTNKYGDKETSIWHEASQDWIPESQYFDLTLGAEAERIGPKHVNYYDTEKGQKVLNGTK